MWITSSLMMLCWRKSRKRGRMSAWGGGGGGWWPSDWLSLCLVICAVLLEVCQDRAYCEVLAESTTFSQDPCPDTYKYLEVHYKCRPNEFERLTVCEGGQMELSCKKAKRLAIYSAMFGRLPNGTDAVSCPPNRPGYIDCQSTDTVSDVRTACQGRKRCDIQASEAVLGNPCASGINKYLSVTFACVPKKILKQIRRHRGRLTEGRKKKKKKKKKKGKKHSDHEEVTKLSESSSTQDDEDTTSPSGGPPIEGPATRLLDTYHNTDTVEKASADSAAKDGEPGLEHPHHIAVTPTPPSLFPNRRPSPDVNNIPPGSDDFHNNNADPDAPRFDPDRASSVPKTDHFNPNLDQDQDQFGQNSDNRVTYRPASSDREPDSPASSDREPDSPASSDREPDRPASSDREPDSVGDISRGEVQNSHFPGSEKQDRDPLELGPDRDEDGLDSNRNSPPHPGKEQGGGEGSGGGGSDSGGGGGNSSPDGDRGSSPDLSELARPKVDESRDNSVSATRPGVRNPAHKGGSGGGEGGGEMSTQATRDSVGSVTGVNLTVLCANHTLATLATPTVRTLPSNEDAPIGVVRELFSVVRFVQGHQEKAILYLMLGVCVGLILLLSAVLGRVCYKLRHHSHAKLDMMEPTHSRNVSHLLHHNNHHGQHSHSLLETPMLEHSDSIDRIEVVRFEPRGTMRSGYHSTLHSDSGERSLNNYYG